MSAGDRGAPPISESTTRPSPDRQQPDGDGINSTPRVSRRRILEVLAVAPLAAVLPQQQPAPRTPHTTPNQPASGTPQPARTGAQAAFFNTREMRTVRVLVDDILPRDNRGGSATDAGVPQWMDAIMSDPDTSTDQRIAIKGGLRWLDNETQRRYETGYASASATQRHAILDDISWPNKAKPEFTQGTSFFVRFRDLTATGYFSSAAGEKDLRYIGNVFNPNWNGCPPEALAKLGVSY